MRKKLAMAFFMLFALSFAFGALATTAHACPSAPDPPQGCWVECNNGFWNVCCPHGTGVVCIESMDCC